ncbi:GNAT family N-acetyltransferase [Arenibacter sp. M-2]|uniref:GNAT family N-acetyltransferase n=1 Tax=Arenibacter sp. M-2 TaxID=3053612 RepID=UPI00257101A9|nr:GNAT family N-acetyltransferase [Arenibacter sp. M-2]MDL5512660.1 GNAT family N-acetyltransferase [Arenibacter sp. M-2]|tara:strand:- start:50483 stop:50950 length:468 start_codon:yes stop_codon:yes gene_type:complete
MELRNLGNDGQIFFEILPEDWRDVIEPIWDDYKEKASIYVFENAMGIIAGGIVFRTAPPNMTDFEIEEWEKYVISNFHYIGFLFVDPKYRGQSLGSKWLTALKEQFPNQSYWLTVEEEGLRSFYVRNGFKCNSISRDEDNPEWIFTYTPGEGSFG